LRFHPIVCVFTDDLHLFVGIKKVVREDTGNGK
jgi:hypothetical protein